MLDKPVVQAFMAQAHKRSLPAKHTLVHADDEPQSIYLILEGSVSVLLEDSDGREVVLAYLNQGEFFGEMCLFPEHQTRSATVRTRTQTLVAEFSYASFRRFVREYPDIMFEIAGQLAGRLRDLNQRIANIAFLDVAGRLTHALLDLSKKPDAMPHPSGVVVRISRQELARHVGCSREMAGRVLKKLKNDGFVHSQGRNILIYGDGPSRAVLSAA
ncbi:MAG TPA: cAMP-activated global transcriptional regulator CRP [Solimonas sp.]|nr:cAMP-activated global transcriptional regulator CRP [Solimonas sp.]